MSKIEYDKKIILGVLRDISEFVVSLDQIGNVHHEFGEAAWKEEIINYLISKKVLDRLANIRFELETPFPDKLGNDGMGYLEREMKGVDYWTFKKYLEKKGIRK